MALIHLALSGLGALPNPAKDASRLKAADQLLSKGLDAKLMLRFLELDGPQHEFVAKFNPAQPRVPAGNGPTSGQWTDADAVGDDDVSSTGRELAEDQGVTPTLVADNTGFHNVVRDEFAEVLAKAGNTVVKEVPITLPGDPPLKAVIDLLIRTSEGNLYGIEVKTGDDPTFTPAQRIVYPHIEPGGIVVSTDPRISALMITPGVPMPAMPVVVLDTRGPGEPIETYPLQNYMEKLWLTS
jgi:hypothetical protein